MSQSQVTFWSYPTRIAFGAGALSVLPEECARLAMSRVLIVTDVGVRRAGIVDRVADALNARGIRCAVFDGISSNPTEREVEAAAEAYQQFGAMGIVGVGGGSPMDTAKLVAVRSATPRPFAELDDALGGDRLVPEALPPVVAIPTTAGTGSEVGRAAVLTVESTSRKTVVFAPQMMPRLALLDPLLSIGLPAGVTAATGFDALTHCVEAYVATGHHPMADAIALHGIEMCAQFLPRAVDDGEDVEARGVMLEVAMMGAAAFQKGLGACHSLAHPLSSVCGLHHGLANALCLPAVADFNESVVSERLARVRDLIGPGHSSCADALRALRRRIDLPSSLREAGVPQDALIRVAEEAVLDGCHRSNPRACTRDDFASLLAAIFEGSA